MFAVCLGGLVSPVRLELNRWYYRRTERQARAVTKVETQGKPKIELTNLLEPFSTTTGYYTRPSPPHGSHGIYDDDLRVI